MWGLGSAWDTLTSQDAGGGRFKPKLVAPAGGLGEQGKVVISEKISWPSCRMRPAIDSSCSFTGHQGQSSERGSHKHVRAGLRWAARIGFNASAPLAAYIGIFTCWAPPACWGHRWYCSRGPPR